MCAKRIGEPFKGEQGRESGPAWEVAGPKRENGRSGEAFRSSKLDAENRQWGRGSSHNGRSVLLRGAHGIGKSQVVRQIAKGFGLQVTDRRLSQMSEGDMIGLPSTDGEVTRFNPPEWYKDACTHARCLFLDELNRGLVGVLNGMFQIVLDRELGNGPDGKPMRLHPDTQVIAAVNCRSHSWPRSAPVRWSPKSWYRAMTSALKK